MTDPELWQLGAREVAAAVADRRVPAVEVVHAALGRIAELSDLLAWATVDGERALAVAEALDRRIAANGRSGLLAGVPIGVKDVIATAGLRTAAGSPLLANNVPEVDATSVSALRAADGIVVGKSVTTEFAYGDPADTLNPWDPARTAGGSSTGSAVAVASGMVPLALGTQTSGSTLRPAAYNGIVGFKPSLGVVATDGILPLAPSFDHVGVLARSVDDAALALEALTGERPASETTRPVRVGVLQGSFIETCDDQTQAHVARVVELLRADRADMVEVDVSAFYTDLMAAFRVVIDAEGAAAHRERFATDPEGYGPRIAALVARGLDVGATELEQANATVRELVARLDAEAEGVDVLLSASTPTPAPAELTSTGDPNNLVIGSVSGMPAISLPSGLSASGLPFGIQLIGHRGKDADLLATAAHLERDLAFDAHPPLWKGVSHGFPAR